MSAEKRKVRGYKISDTPYKKAIKRGEKENTPLATMLEQVVIAFSKGHDILYMTREGNYQQLSKLY